MDVDSPASEPPAKPSGQTGAPKRRVFFLVDSFLLGGTETQAVELARRLDPAQYEVIIGCLRQEGPLLQRLANTPVRIMHVEMKGGIDSPSGVLAVLKLARFLRSAGIDIVHAHDLWSNMVGMSAAALARVPVRITSQRDLSHDAWYGTYRRRVLRFVQARSSAVLTNAQAIREGLIGEGLDHEKVKVVHNGVDVERFRDRKSDRSELLPGSVGKTLVVLVGNMNSDVKGHPHLISAASQVVKRFPAAQFVLVGDGPMRSKFESQAASAGLSEHFMFLGRRTDVAEILACCDIAVLPSLAEGLPNAVLEYLAAGLPVVASALGGNLEVIQDGVNGLLVQPQDSAGLARLIEGLIEDEEFRRRLGAAGRRHVEENFSFERLVEEVDKLYTGLLQSAGRRH